MYIAKILVNYIMQEVDLGKGFSKRYLIKVVIKNLPCLVIMRTRFLDCFDFIIADISESEQLQVGFIEVLKSRLAR